MPASETIVVFSQNIGPGATNSWFWNNPTFEAVHSFAALPHNVSASSGSWNSLEVKQVRCEEQAGTSKRRISYQVFNPTSFTINYEIHMGVISQT